MATPAIRRRPLDVATAAVVSFHYGLPARALVDRIKATGAKLISSATTVAETTWLADGGCDAAIAQGAEAGGHRGMFLATDATGRFSSSCCSLFA